jgi:hypothetical protein
MEGKIKRIKEKVERGSAEVKALFGRAKTISAGCLVTEGKLMKKGVLEVYRGRKELVWEGSITSLRRFKEEVSEVQEGVECGINCEEFWEWQEGDRIKFFELVERKLSLEESHADVAMDFEEGLKMMGEEYLEEQRRIEAGEEIAVDKDFLNFKNRRRS